MKQLGKLTILTTGLMMASLALGSIAPLAGFYASQELVDDSAAGTYDGVVLDGHWSEAFPAGGEGQPGNTIHAASWNDVALATEWELSGPAIVNVQTLLDTPVEKIFYTTYTGGTLTLKNTGPWWNPADVGTEYTLTIDSYSHTTTKTYVGGVEESSRTTAVLSATFDDNPSATVEFIIASAVPVGSGATPPTEYPEFAVSAPVGAWGNVQKIEMLVVPEPATLVLLGLGGVFSVISRKRKTA